MRTARRKGRRSDLRGRARNGGALQPHGSRRHLLRNRLALWRLWLRVRRVQSTGRRDGKVRARDWTALKVAWWVVGMMAALDAALKGNGLGFVGVVAMVALGV